MSCATVPGLQLTLGSICENVNMKSYVQAVRHMVYVLFDSLLATHRQGKLPSLSKYALAAEAHSAQEYGIRFLACVHEHGRWGEGPPESHAALLDGSGHPARVRHREARRGKWSDLTVNS